MLDIKKGSIYKFRKNFNSLGEIRLFIQIFLLLLMLPLLLKFFSVPGIMKKLTSKRLKVYDNTSLKNLIIEKTVHYTDYILSHYFWTRSSSCLKRSLAIYYILRKYGFDIQICLGVKYNNEPSLSDLEEKKLDGHAWLIYNGNFFVERDPETARTYKTTYCFPDTLNP